MMEFNTNEKYAIISVLWEIMKADGVIDEREKDFMNEVYSFFGISVKELQNILDMNLVQSKIILKSMTYEKKIEANKYFTHMSACDGFVDDRETEIIKWLE